MVWFAKQKSNLKYLLEKQTKSEFIKDSSRVLKPSDLYGRNSLTSFAHPMAVSIYNQYLKLQSVELFCFVQENKNSKVVNFLPNLAQYSIHVFKILRALLTFDSRSPDLKLLAFSYNMLVWKKL